MGGVNPNSQTWRGGDTELWYMEKKEYLLCSVVGLIAWVRPLPRHATVETQGRLDVHTHVGQYWRRRKSENRK